MNNYSLFKEYNNNLFLLRCLGIKVSFRKRASTFFNNSCIIKMCY